MNFDWEQHVHSTVLAKGALEYQAKSYYSFLKVAIQWLTKHCHKMRTNNEFSWEIVESLKLEGFLLWLDLAQKVSPTLMDFLA